MDQKELDMVTPMHQETILRHQQEEVRKRALLTAMFEQALVRQQEAEKRGQTLVEAMHKEALSNGRENPAVDRPKGIHYTELRPLEPGQPLADEWNTYCREVGRLLADGQEGRHVLIKGQEIIGIFDTSDAAYAEGLKRYLGQPFFIHPIRAEEPYLRIRGVNYPWPSSLSK